MRVEVITIGDELLLGLTIDTNAAWLARQLATFGVAISARATVADRSEEIQSAVRQALDRTGAVITTGGLGPTADDLTVAAVAAVFRRPLRFDEQLWERLRGLWRERGRGEPPEANRQQCLVPEGATILPNRHGTAPGLWLEDAGGRWAALLPGVPREMRGLAAEELIPRLRARLGDAVAVLQTLTLRTTGIAESQLPTLLGKYAAEIDGMRLAYQPSPAGVDVRLSASGADAAALRERLARAAAELRRRVGVHVYGTDTQDLAEVVLQGCRERDWHIAVAESCTGGLLGERLTSVPGASAVFLGGVIAYDNTVKESLLGVAHDSIAAHGAVSEAVARRMAQGARERTGAEVGIAITGIAGPDGGTPEKPVGTVWLAVDTPAGPRTYGGRFIGDRGEIRYRATQSALDLLRRTLQGA